MSSSVYEDINCTDYFTASWLYIGYFFTCHYTVELQWLEHLWDRENLFEAWVIRATAG